MTLPVQPLPPTDDGSVARRVQHHLRSLVLDGTLTPGAEFSQVELARALGVSRTPLREALRMLQEEGLVDAEQNRMARITACDPLELDAVYAARVGLESTAVALTAAHCPPGTLAELEDLLEAMESHSGDLGAFQPMHRRFHQLLVSGAPLLFRRTVQTQQDRAERYWRLLNELEAAPHTRRDREHREIVAAVRAGDGVGASTVLAQHLARTALTLITHMAPDQDVPATRAAVRVCAARRP